jgi:hypothetical protein
LTADFGTRALRSTDPNRSVCEHRGSRLLNERTLSDALTVTLTAPLSVTVTVSLTVTLTAPLTATLTVTSPLRSDPLLFSSLELPLEALVR